MTKQTGRPRKIDAPTRERLLRRIMKGDSLASAARAAGCSARTVQRTAARDADFQWRLELARRVRDNQLSGAPATPPYAPAVRLDSDWRLYCVRYLHDELRRLWGDKTAKPVVAKDSPLAPPPSVAASSSDGRQNRATERPT